MIRAQCSCGEVFHAGPEHAGQRIRCRCGRVVDIPSPDGDAVVARSADARSVVSRNVNPSQARRRGAAGIAIGLVLVLGFWFDSRPSPIHMAAAEAGPKGVASTASPQPLPPAVASCASSDSIKNGARIVRVRHPGRSYLRVENGTDADASVMLVRPVTRGVVAGMFVRAGANAVLRGVPQGTWQVQFRLGHGWQRAKRAFCDRVEDSRFADLMQFAELRNVAEAGGSTVRSYSITLEPVAGGNARIVPMDSDEIATEDDDRGP